MVEPIATDAGEIFSLHPHSTVEVARSLSETDFHHVEFLYCLRLRRTVAPDIDVAILEYHYGRGLREPDEPLSDVSPFDNFVGKYVRVRIPTTEPDDKDLVWYGVIEHETRLVHGAGHDGQVPMGVQQFTAYGLLRLLERQTVRKTVLMGADGEQTFEIPVGLPFNVDRRGALPSLGNRSELSVASLSMYVFSYEPRSRDKWNALQAVRYLLAVHGPVKNAGEIVGKWEVDRSSSTAAIEWYEIALETDGRSVKQLLDELIPRQRGVGYYVEYDDHDNTIKLKLFSFLDQPLTLPSGATIPENANQRSLDFDNALDIEEAVVSTVESGRYHRVIARGQKRTSTFTSGLEKSWMWKPDWTSAEEEEYRLAASQQPGYADLSAEEQHQANALSRSNERLKNVFCRFQFSPDQYYVTNVVAFGKSFPFTRREFWMAPKINDEFEKEKIEDDTPAMWRWSRGYRFLRTTTLLDRHDYSGGRIAARTTAQDLEDKDVPDYREPFAFAVLDPSTSPHWTDFSSVDQTAPRWCLLHQRHLATPAAGDVSRQWSAGLHVSSTDAAVSLTVHPQHFLARSQAGESGFAPCSPDHDPKLCDGLNYQQIQLTLTAEIDEYVEASQVLSTPEYGLPESVLVINVLNARWDYVLPWTVVEIKNGLRVFSEGGLLRNDLKRLQDIAAAAAEWYSRPRQTLRISYKTLRNLFDLGWLITEFGQHQQTGVFTPITAIDYLLGNGQDGGRISIETSFAQLDLGAFNDA